MNDRLGLTGQNQFRFAVCLSEAYTNAYLHGNRLDPTKLIVLRFFWDEETVRVEVDDEGEGDFSETSLEAARPDVFLEKSGGRGVGIIKKYADRIDIQKRPEGGLRFSMVFTHLRQGQQSGIPPRR
jgi:serine/threonine-protein kinase RsbW